MTYSNTTCPVGLDWAVLGCFYCAANRHGANRQLLRGFPIRDEARGFDREALRTMLLGSQNAVEQGMIDLERRGYCDSFAWSRPIPTPQNQLIIQLQPGEILRLHKRWLPLLDQRIFL